MSPSDKASQWLARLQDENVTAEDRAEFYKWLAADTQNEAAFEHLEHSVARLHEVRAALRDRYPVSEPSSSRRNALTAVGVAAVIVLGIVAYGLSNWSPSYTTARGEQRTLTLADGSEVELNTDTRLVVHFRDDIRRVRLERGEAVFDVAHDASRPFIVDAAGTSVRAVGTQFAVRVDARDLSVVVIEGVVAVALTANSEPQTSSPPRLAAGQRLEVRNDARQVSHLPAEAIARELAWRDGMIDVAGVPLRTVLDEIERYHDVRFILDDPALGDVPIWVYVEASDLDAFLHGLAANPIAPSPLAIERNGNVVHISQSERGAP